MKKNAIKAFAGDLIYSIGALVLFNGVMQMVVYPYFTKTMGADKWGVILTILSVVSIMATSFGSGANYSRMVVSTKGKEVKGDYNIFLAIVGALAVVVSAVTSFMIGEASFPAFFGILVLMLFSILRYYGDVEFRLNLNYKGLFLYYVAITAGYLVGVLTYQFIGSWAVSLMLGEILATGYVVIFGSIYKRPLFRKSENFVSNVKSMTTLSGAYLVSNIVLNADRILILMFVGSTEVTIFYTATLVGKIVAMLTSPLNGVITGHLAKYKGGLTKKMLGIITAALIGIAAVVSLGSIVVSYIFVKIMYPEIFDAVRPYFFLANAGQIFYFVSETFMVILLRFTKERMQLTVNIVYAVAFFVVAIPSVIYGGLMGIAVAILVMNIARFLFVAAIGLKNLAETGEE